MPRFCYVLDLKDDPALIADYERYHEPGNVWPAILADIAARGYEDMEIWRSGDRLVMIAEVADDFPRAGRPAEVEAIVERWEALMATFQRPVPHAAEGEKWAPMRRIFALNR